MALATQGPGADLREAQLQGQKSKTLGRLWTALELLCALSHLPMKTLNLGAQQDIQSVYFFF